MAPAADRRALQNNAEFTRLCHKRLHRRTARRTSYMIGQIIKKVYGERAFTNKLTFV